MKGNKLISGIMEDNPNNARCETRNISGKERVNTSRQNK
jgi:hypothetical protein